MENREIELEKKIAELEKEIAKLKQANFFTTEGRKTVSVPEEIQPLFDKAQNTVDRYFSNMKFDPSKAMIKVDDQRYILLRASSLSCDFLETIQQLYADRGEEKAFQFGLDFLFDIAHLIGMEDAKNFHQKMNLQNPMEKLSAGPIHFAYTGWAFVELLPESNPDPSPENFYLKYHHPYSFEAASWLKAKKKAQKPICIMNAGYSSGWCEQSFGLPLTAVEISCRAKGDENCTFIMASPHNIDKYLEKNTETHQNKYHIPLFFDRKRTEEEMRKTKIEAESASKAKSQFLANMSHEIRTPMNAIIGFADLLQYTKLTDEQIKYLEIIKSSGDLLVALIDDILDISVIEAGKLKLDEKELDIEYMVKNLIKVIEPRLDEKNINFSYMYINKVDDYLIGDPTRIRQIFLNLLNNAIKFTDKNGEISLKINFLKNSQSDFSQKIEVTVKDNGIGIPLDKQQEIFEAFSQVEMSLTRMYEGVGLGLTITKNLVEAMGGEIWVESNIGKGSEFTFTLKLKRSRQKEEAPKKEESYKLIKTVLKDISILLVEDDLLNQQVIKLMLSHFGASVDIASNGQEAINCLIDTKYHLVLMDIQMPIVNGFEATRRIREMNINVPIIALTAQAMAEDRDLIIEAGMNDYIFKPVHQQDLVRKILKYATEN